MASVTEKTIINWLLWPIVVISSSSTLRIDCNKFYIWINTERQRNY